MVCWFEIENSTDVQSKEFKSHKMFTGLYWKFMCLFMRMMSSGMEICQMSILLQIIVGKWCFQRGDSKCG